MRTFIGDSPPASRLDRFLEARERFFNRYVTRWPGVLSDPYDLLEVQEIDQSDVRAVERTAAGVGRIYDRVAAVLHALSDEALLDLGVRPETFDLARTTIPGLEVPPVARVDLARTPEGYKLLEYNGEAAGLIVETFAVNGLACAESARHDVNAGCDSRLGKALCAALRLAGAYVGASDATIVNFSYGRDSTRDRATAQYLAERVRESSDMRPVEIPMESLRLGSDGLFLPDGRKLDVLWRACPVHYLGAPLSSSEMAPAVCARELTRLIRERRLAIVNAPDASLLASKATQAVIWGLAHEGRFFAEAEIELIRNAFLPTFLEPPQNGAPYVIKPAFGSEGDSVSIVDPVHQKVRTSRGSSFQDETQIYQQFVGLPTARLMTERGERDLHLMVSCFLVSGEPMGIIVRAGGEITDEQAWVVPVAIGTSP
jgi:glutathionylspermidine synthase